jgi:hypothetical protein
MDDPSGQKRATLPHSIGDADAFGQKNPSGRTLQAALARLDWYFPASHFKHSHLPGSG